MAVSSHPTKPPLSDINISGSAEQKELTQQQQYARTGAKEKAVLQKEKEILLYHQKQEARTAAIDHRRMHAQTNERRDINILNSKISREILKNVRRLQTEADAQVAQAEATKTSQDRTHAAAIRDTENRLAIMIEKISHLDKMIMIQTDKIHQLEQQHQVIQGEVISLESESKQHEKLLDREHREAERVAAQTIEIQAVADDFLKDVVIESTDSVADKAAKLTESWKVEIEATEKDIETTDAQLKTLTDQISALQSELKTVNDPTQQASISEALAKVNAEHQRLDFQRDWQQWGLISAYDAYESAGDRYTQKQAKADRTRIYHAKTVQHIDVLESKLQALQAQHEVKSKALSDINATLNDHKTALEAMEAERSAYLAQRDEIEFKLKQLREQHQIEMTEIDASDELGITRNELTSARDALLKLQKQLLGMTQKALPNFETRLENLDKKIERQKQQAPQSPELVKLEKQRVSIISNIDKTQNQISKKEADITAQESKIKALESKFELKLHALPHEPTHHKGLTPKYELYQASQREAAKVAKETSSETRREGPVVPRKFK
ncbi:MAG: hypothetical protein U1E78_06270 [Gammaproteobacteria bacterium]